MLRKYRDRKRITVYLDAEEYDRIREAAGGDGRISEWARAKLVGENNHAEVLREPRKVRMAGRGTSALERPRVAMGREADAKRLEQGIQEPATNKVPCKHGAMPGLCRFSECNTRR